MKVTIEMTPEEAKKLANVPDIAKVVEEKLAEVSTNPFDYSDYWLKYIKLDNK